MPSPPPLKTYRHDEFSSPRYQKPQQLSPRSTINNRRSLPPIGNKSKYLTLQEVLAQNRAQRGSRIPVPRREVYEDQIYDLPTYRRNYVKNGFIVHK